MAKAKLTVEGVEIKLLKHDKKDYISLTDIAKQVGERTDIILSNWLRSPGTLNYLNEWEMMYNEDFNEAAYDGIRKRVGNVGFYLSSKEWIGATNAIGIISKQGRGGGTYAQKDIAFEFCMAVSAKFKLYMIQEFERLKMDEAAALGLDWNIRRELTKINYHLHTDAVREHRVPLMDWNTKREAIVMASEADLLNMVLFGQSAKEWRIANADKKGNMRDHATMEELVVLSNMSSLNAYFLQSGLDKTQRFQLLVKEAGSQLVKLNALKSMRGIRGLE
jgi:hypothetical protein